MKLCVFEDQKYEELFPLTMTRATFELKCGHTTLLEKILRNFPNVGVSYFLRDYLVPTFKKRIRADAVNNMDVFKKDDFLLVNGRWLFNGKKLELEGEEEVGVCNKQLVYARVRQRTLRECLSENFEKFLNNIQQRVDAREVEANLISYPWNLISNNPKTIEEDFKAENKRGIFGKFSSRATILGEKENVFIAETAEVQPNVVLDATEGPIIIDEEAIIHPFSHIKGPSSIGKKTRVLGAKIREGVSVGPVCLVGGEIEESIIYAYTNKCHAGFLGHSYLGEWVNIGGSTVTSDLKNDYSSVQVHVKGKLVDTGEMKVGSFIGDHTKTSIGCLLNTGTVIGVMSNVLASGEPSPKFIPSFCWYFRGRFSKGEGLRRMINTARVVTRRRGVTLTAEDIELWHKLYDITGEERETLIKRSRTKLKRRRSKHRNLKG